MYNDINTIIIVMFYNNNIQVKRGLELGLAPTLSLEGTGGTYFLTDTRKRKLAAFKPQDEELRRLREENRILRMERDLLKKTMGCFVERPK